MDLNLGSTKALIDECRRQGLLRNQCAYVLATAYHETAHTMKPIYERGSKAYFNKYDAGTKIGKNLGNTKKGDGYLYRGRGFVQLTGRANYAKYGLVDNPDKALDPKVAADIAVTGMRKGTFTGKKLADYLTEGKSDFINARRIINGKDRAALIANHARDYDMDLQVIGYAQKKPSAGKRLIKSAEEMRAGLVTTIPPIEPKPAPAPEPASDKEMIQRVQAGLTLLKYNPGGTDGLMGPLTKGAILAFRNDHDLPPGDFIDEELIKAIGTATPREMVPARANATGNEIAAKVPEANAHWWNKWLGGGAGGGLGAAALVDAIAPTKGYMEQIREVIGDVPQPIWIGLGAALLLTIAYMAWRGQKSSDEAYRTGERR